MGGCKHTRISLLYCDREYKQTSRLLKTIPHFLIIDLVGHLNSSIHKNQPSTSNAQNWQHNRYTNFFLFSTLKSTLKFEVSHLTSEVAEVIGGPKKLKCPNFKSDITFSKKNNSSYSQKCNWNVCEIWFNSFCRFYDERNFCYVVSIEWAVGLQSACLFILSIFV